MHIIWHKVPKSKPVLLSVDRRTAPRLVLYELPLSALRAGDRINSPAGEPLGIWTGTQFRPAVQFGRLRGPVETVYTEHSLILRREPR